MFPVIRALQKISNIETLICVTGQHREMLNQVLEMFSIEPDFDLDVMEHDQGLTGLTAAVLVGLEPILKEVRPDLVLVHGDTSTTVAASLAAYYQKICVGHVEAGLRTNNIYAPWPEEINRRIVGTIASIHFAPTETAVANLIAAGVPLGTIHNTGNTVVDALWVAIERLEADTIQSALYDELFDFDPNKRMILVTGHRRENLGEGIREICRALTSLSKRPDVHIVYAVHPNPNVRKPVEELLGKLANVKLVPPQNYLPFVHLIRRAAIILTDSGGLQEEAASLGKPVLIMRDTTERPEGVAAGAAKLVGCNSSNIQDEIERLLDDGFSYVVMSRAENPYGDGKSAHRIAKIIQKHFNAHAQ